MKTCKGICVFCDKVNHATGTCLLGYNQTKPQTKPKKIYIEVDGRRFELTDKARIKTLDAFGLYSIYGFKEVEE